MESYSVGAYFYQLKPIWEESFFRLMDAVLGRKLLFHLENGAVLESAGSLDDLAGQLMQYSNFFPSPPILPCEYGVYPEYFQPFHQNGK